jgi:hypothetical protein
MLWSSPSSLFPPLEPEDEESKEGQEEEDKGDTLWYFRELGEVVSFFPGVPSNSPACPDSPPTTSQF